MVKLESYFEDGACVAAQAVMVLAKGMSTIDSSWNSEYKEYDAKIKVARWENCREQGYVFFLRSKDYQRQLNVAFFEHRNSDSICAVKWEQITGNASPNIDMLVAQEDVYTDKWDVSHTVSYNEHYQMAEWIVKQFNDFWEETSVK
jgi:hypothetical protein